MITLKQGADFSATIQTKKIYRSFESAFTVTVINNGSAGENLPKTLLFTDNYACATFKVYLKETLIPIGESEVILIFDGIYKRDTCTDKNISLNGSNGILKINCSGSGGGENPLEKPVIQNKNISLNNRTNLNFNDVNFPSLYYSPIASPLAEISFWGDVSTITYNGTPYIANTFIPFSDISDVLHIAPNVDSATNYGVYYSVKDADGNLSDFAILNISNNAFGTIVWGNKYISIREEAGYVTRIFTVSYTGASGQSVMFGDLVHSELGANSFDLYINETKTLTGSGSLEFKINGDISSDGSVSITILANLFGSLTIRIGVIVTVVEEPEP